MAKKEDGLGPLTPFQCFNTSTVCSLSLALHLSHPYYHITPQRETPCSKANSTINPCCIPCCIPCSRKRAHPSHGPSSHSRTASGAGRHRAPEEESGPSMTQRGVGLKAGAVLLTGREAVWAADRGQCWRLIGRELPDASEVSRAVDLSPAMAAPQPTLLRMMALQWDAGGGSVVDGRRLDAGGKWSRNGVWALCRSASPSSLSCYPVEKVVATRYAGGCLGG